MTLEERLALIRLVALDVDGVLTDGSIVWAAGGVELKVFSVKDGLGIRLLRDAGIEIAIVTARGGAAVELRARELGIRHLYQNEKDKVLRLEAIARDLALRREQVLYVGDDLPDWKCLAWAGVAAAPADAAPEIRSAAHIVTRTPGGRGAVREIAEAILRAQGRWEQCIGPFRPAPPAC